MKIGVFDSGVGGKAVAAAISRALPNHEIILREDKENLPYGTKSPEKLLELVLPILQQMVEQGCRVIVIACNTVSTNIISELRKELKVPLVGMEPMVKPASQLSSTGVIAVFATPATLKSQRYTWLKNEYCKKVAVIEPDCSDWAQMIENKQINRDKIAKIIKHCLQKKADILVLGCTHYHWIEQTVMEIAGSRARVIQPEEPAIKQLKRVLAQLD